MVAELANTTVTVLRGTAENDYGDTVDAGLPLIEGLPACLLERTQTVQDPATQTPRIVRGVVCHVPVWAGVLATDQVVDEKTGDKFMVEDIWNPTTLVGSTGMTSLTLTRVTAASPA